MTREQDVLTLISAVNALTRIAAIETHNETPSAQWRTLSLLRDNGPLRLGELAALSRVSQPGMTRLVGQMVDAGLLDRTADAADSRAIVLSTTGAGLAALDEWREQLSAALAPRLADLDDDEWEALATTAAILARKTAAMEVAR